MKLVGFLALIAFAYSAAINNDRRVLVLDKGTFAPFVTDNKHVLVHFCKLTETAVTLVNNVLIVGEIFGSRASSFFFLAEQFLFILSIFRCAVVSLPQIARTRIHQGS